MNKINRNTKLLFLFVLLICTNTYSQIGTEEHIIIDSSFWVNSAQSVYSVDIDSDGDMDVLSASGGDSKIAWYENTDGQGNFGAQQVITLNAVYATSVFASDLDGDGDLDVLSASGGDNKIAWYENIDGQGNFGPQQIITLEANSARSVYSSDIDGDGDMDVLSASSVSNSDKIAWYENIDGQGSFGPQQIISTSVDGANSVFAIDIDNDGDVDVLSASSFDDKVAWYENIDGQGSFGIQQIISSNAEGANSVFAIDIDGDGDLDVLSTSYNDGKTAWYENTDGLGSFGIQQIIDTNIEGANFVFAVDIDDDGDIDVLSTSTNEHKIVWYENIDGLGNFGLQQIISTNAYSVSSVFVADIDTDGDIDVLSSSASVGHKIVWYKNTNGQGSFGNQQFISTHVDGPGQVYSIDIDGDGDLDVISASYSDDKIAWYENFDGLGNFGLQQIISAEADNVLSVFAVDIDGDDDIDVISASLLDSKIAWFENIDGQGDFSSEQIITNSAEYARSVYASDIDGDGDMDVLAGYTTNTGLLAWFENIDGQGNFGPAQPIGTNEFSTPKSIFTIDVDGDSDMDVFSAFPEEDKITWYENLDGQGTFGSENIVSLIVDYPQSIYSDDIDGDGDKDVLSASFYDNKIAWYENVDGQGTFGTQKIITTNANSANSVYSSDIDGDGDLDVLSASSDDDKIAWYENIDGQGLFGSQQIITSNANGAASVYSADIDNDNDMDILMSSIFDNKIAWYENLGPLYNEINGNISFDLNSNGCNTIAPPIPNVLVKTDNNLENIATLSLNNGFYQIFPSEGNYSTTIVVPDYFTGTPNFHTSNFIGSGNTDIADFCLTPVQIIDDLSISLFSTNEARPGFDITYQLVYSNSGTTQLEGNVILEYEDNKLLFLSASETLSTQTNNSLTFDYSNLSPFESRTINFQFNIYSPPIVNIGNEISLTAKINPIIGDHSEGDNIFIYEQDVIGSYDPNDIAVMEGDQILIENTNKYLHYIIRFQNTGTASAINVNIENILDDNLDWSTFQLESYSHTNRVEIRNGNDVSFIFDNIYLPDSTSNELESHGFIAYKIKPKSNIIVGEIILNKAYIFFDFNEAIETNTVSTEVIETVSINQYPRISFSIYPIPVKDIIIIKSDKALNFLEIFNQFGQLVLSSSNPDKIDISSLEQGVYFCKAFDKHGRFGIKKLIKI